MKNKSLLKYLPISIFRNIISEKINQENSKIQLNNFIGSSKSVLASSIIKKSKSPQLFILNDKESASYFINDLENLINHEIFFYPASYRRSYQIEDTDNSNEESVTAGADDII